MSIFSSIIAEGIREARPHVYEEEVGRLPCKTCGKQPEELMISNGTNIYRCCKVFTYGAERWNEVMEGVWLG